MPELSFEKKRIHKNLAGVNEIPVAANRTHHDIAIECSTAGVTFDLKRKKHGGSVYMPFSDNSVAANASASLLLPGTESFEITPSDSGAQYTVIVDSF